MELVDLDIGVVPLIMPDEAPLRHDAIRRRRNQALVILCELDPVHV
jgi:hypothetical protein